MPAQILDGKDTATALREVLAAEVSQWLNEGGPLPTLAAVLVGDDPASQVYVRNKERACEKAGMRSRLIRKPATTSTAELLDLLADLNADQEVHGILVQLPLPVSIDTQRVLDAVSPEKDVDAFAPENVGLLVQGRPRFLPCTPHGVMQLLARYGYELAGKHVVVVGRSDIVGKPMANMLIQRDIGFGSAYANATVTVCHSQSRDLAEITRSADVLIAAVGKANLITAEMVQSGAVVIDVGINRLGDKLVGDVDFESVREIAGAITPVPGGIGPLTIAMLLRNTLTACQQQMAAVK
ncbi:MAG: bifunctional methylenetetrahydrofolate dehydrogenase/methenyltetrahydrofolate cyclohydrolase FolD [Pirellulaceae bacterium]